MKKISLFCTIILIFMAIVVDAQVVEKDDVSEKTSTIKASPDVIVRAGEKIILMKANVENNNCKTKIEKNMAYVKGVKDVKAEILNNIVTVVYDPIKTNEATLLKELKKLGMGGEIVKDPKISTTTFIKSTKKNSNEILNK